MSSETAVTDRSGSTLREYVRSEDLNRVIEEWLAANEGRTVDMLAGLAGCSTRAINKIRNGHKPFQTIFLADKLLTAMERHVIELSTCWRTSHARDTHSDEAARD